MSTTLSRTGQSVPQAGDTSWSAIVLALFNYLDTNAALTNLASLFADGMLQLAGATSGTTTLKSAAAAGSTVLTFPSGTDTVVTLNATQNLSGKTLSNCTIAGTQTIADTANLVFNTSTGSKIGTATTQKIGFYNATPIVQPSVSTNLITLLQNLGFIAAGTYTGDAKVRRVFAQGTAHVAGDWSLSGWGSGAAVTVAGSDQSFKVNITAGTTPGANPTATLTYKDGTFTTTPNAALTWGAGTTGAMAHVAASPAASSLTVTYVGTPVNTSVYSLHGVLIGS